MVNNQSQLVDPIIDELAAIPGALGKFVCDYPGIHDGNEPDWLEHWFVRRSEAHFTDSLSDHDHVLPLRDFKPGANFAATAFPATLISIHPQHFRGFRRLSDSIHFDSQLVVIDGPNSSGKTSLGEAIEWLLTGALSRREGRDHGSPRELENCIANQFRPASEKTWVAGTLRIQSGSNAEAITLRRELVRDYGPTGTSRSESKLFVGDTELSHDDELTTLERLFGSVPPILMQHTLRYFVESNPDKRRQYFERLLRLNQLTDLISRAVIGNPRLPEFRSPQGGAALDAWRSLGSMADQQPISRTLRRSSSRSTNDIERSVRQALTEIAKSSITAEIDADLDFEGIRRLIDEEQRRTRQQSFPPLESLRPQTQLADGNPPPAFDRAISESALTLADTREAFARAHSQLTDGNVNRAAIAHAMAHLLKEGVIDPAAEGQLCPLCNYTEANSLTQRRIHEIQRWLPLFREEQNALESLTQAKSKLLDALKRPINNYHSLLPTVPPRAKLRPHLHDSHEDLVGAVDATLKVRNAASRELEPSILVLSNVIAKIEEPTSDAHDINSDIQQSIESARALESIYTHAKTYAVHFDTIENAVGVAAREDPQYNLRDSWLECAAIRHT